MKNILISGANEGIGYYMAKQLLVDGNRVYVLDENNESINKLKEDYTDKLFVYKCDVRNYKKVQDIANNIGEIDIAVHNACKCTFDSFMDTSIDIFKEVFDVNYFGAVNIAKAVIPNMKEGRVLFVSSGVGIMGFKNLSPYSSSKSAIECLARCLNLEYKNEPISFHLIHPPLTNTKSASPLPIPNEMMSEPETVGRGIAKRIMSRSYIICHSIMQRINTQIIYLFPIGFGRLFSKLTDNYKYNE